VVAYTWYHPPVFWDYVEAQSRINREILRRFAEEGIGFAFPTTTTILEPGGAPLVVEMARP